MNSNIKGEKDHNSSIIENQSSKVINAFKSIIENQLSLIDKSQCKDQDFPTKLDFEDSKCDS